MHRLQHEGNDPGRSMFDRRDKPAMSGVRAPCDLIDGEDGRRRNGSSLQH